MLQLHDVYKQFDGREVANGISLTVACGEVVALLGPSGSGKSSLLNMVAGLLKPDRGQVVFDGVDVTALPPEKRRFGLMFQDFALFPHLNVLQNIMFGPVEQRVPRREAAQLAAELLQRVGLAGYEQRKTWTLSGGEQQRVALARVLAAEPRLVLLDEPFSSLDAHLRQQLQQEFRDHLLARSMPSLLVTHDRDEAFAMADRVAVLHQGNIVQIDTPAKLLAQPASAWLAGFIGLDNVLESGVVPDSAFVFGKGSGQAILLACERRLNTSRLALQLPEGQFVTTLSARECYQYGVDALKPGDSLAVSIDWQQLIAFRQ